MKATAEGVKDLTPGESWIQWAVYPPDTTNDEILWEWGEFQCGPGRLFGKRPHIRRTSTRVLVTQYGGLDV